jgi:hypothetical protein
VNHPTDQRCGNCLYWEQSEDTTSEGECHRRAPRPTASEEAVGLKVWWPETLSVEWCGEWAPAAQLQGKVEG